ncbi:peptidase [Cylindrobasidium torrendii FP15055 ss-10]|uniref:Peptide hydrolase n=1 Tax=Cylindrobasidium torrendii FP15055 ss-10 TaxID=1314674 RepID=A0A0D7BRX2_9AGAR|nr:peptidase [Cylindrobasidium torrendii FP15055 ss-10]
MKFALTALAAVAAASPIFEQETFNSEPGFSLDLNAQRLVQLEGQPPVWMTELDKIKAKAQNIKFFDITDTQDLESFAATSHVKFEFPATPTATDKVTSVIKTLSTKGPRANLEKFSSFRTRYYRSDTGKDSQQWLLSKIQDITKSASSSLKELVNLSEFSHSWGQNSIILSINGSTTPDEVVIVSAHQDSTNMWPFLPAPGADDDGSGTVTILEAYRALVAADFKPERTVQFHWYSAEEGGLLGSQAVAKEYAARSVKVVAMNQFDMTAWVKKGTREEAGIITDFVNEDLTAFNKKLVDTYLDIPYVETKCGYACSDHASWGKAGYASGFTIESSFENSNHYIHSANDRIDISEEFSFTHMLEFSKLAVAFAIELGGWA